MVHHQHLPQPATTRCTGLTSASEDRKRSAKPIVPAANGISIKWYAVPACLQRRPSQERATRVQSRSRRAFSSSCGQHWLVCLAVSASTFPWKVLKVAVLFRCGGTYNKQRVSATKPILYVRVGSACYACSRVIPSMYHHTLQLFVQQLFTLVACSQFGHMLLILARIIHIIHTSTSKYPSDGCFGRLLVRLPEYFSLRNN